MNTKNILISLTTGSSVCGIAVGASYYFINNKNQPKNIREYLAKEDLQILNTNLNENTQDTIWKNLIKKHVATTQPIDSNRKIKGLTFKTQNAQDPVTEDIRALKEKCENLLSKPISAGEEFNTNLRNVRDWCNGKSELAK